jgi:RecA-family ATPase
MLSLIAGMPEAGKSMLSVYMAAQVSSGRPWCDEPGKWREPGSVIMISNEDDPERVVKPRLQAAEAGMDRVFVLGEYEFKGEKHGIENLTQEFLVLKQAVESRGDIKLIVIDPITGYMGSKNENKNAEVREFLAPLSQLAGDHGIAVVGITHMGKNQEAAAASKVLGSTAFVAAPRVVWGVKQDAEALDRNRKLMVLLKSNLGQRVDGLAYQIESKSVELNDGGMTQSGWCVFEKEPVLARAEQVFGPPQNQRGRPRKQERATDWLLAYLEDGPKSSKDVFMDGESHDPPYSKSALERIKKAERIQSYVIQRDDGTVDHWDWALPTD